MGEVAFLFGDSGEDLPRDPVLGADLLEDLEPLGGDLGLGGGGGGIGEHASAGARAGAGDDDRDGDERGGRAGEQRDRAGEESAAPASATSTVHRLRRGSLAGGGELADLPAAVGVDQVEVELVRHAAGRGEVDDRDGRVPGEHPDAKDAGVLAPFGGGDVRRMGARLRDEPRGRVPDRAGGRAPL